MIIANAITDGIQHYREVAQSNHHSNNYLEHKAALLDLDSDEDGEDSCVTNKPKHKHLNTITCKFHRRLIG